MWIRYKVGATIGEAGSEDGTIIADEEHWDGARITLEQDCRINIPYAITAGLYGIMVHTAFASKMEEANKKYKEMKLDLEEALNICKHGTDEELGGWIEKFCNNY